MRYKLITGSGNTDFADLVCHLLDYNARERWTPTQALQQPCVQAMKAACSRPPVSQLLAAVRAGPIFEDADVPLQALAASTCDDGGSLQKKTVCLGVVDQVADAEGSPRIAAAASTAACKVGADSGIMLDSLVAAQLQLVPVTSVCSFTARGSCSQLESTMQLLTAQCSTICL